MSSIEEKFSEAVRKIPFFMIRAHKILKTGGRKNFNNPSYTHTELLLKITMSLLASLAHKNECGQLAYAYASNKKFNELRMLASLAYAYAYASQL